MILTNVTVSYNNNSIGDVMVIVLECCRSWVRAPVGSNHDYEIGICRYPRAVVSVNKDYKNETKGWFIKKVTCSRHDIAEKIDNLALNNNHPLSYKSN